MARRGTEWIVARRKLAMMDDDDMFWYVWMIKEIEK